MITKRMNGKEARNERILRKKVILNLLFLYLSITLSCAQAAPTVKYTVRITAGPQNHLTQDKISIAVLDLETKCNDIRHHNCENAGFIVAETLLTELISIQKYTIIERQQMNRLIEELRFSMSDLVSRENLKRLGKLGNVDAVVLGTVLSWSTIDQIFNVRLVDTQTGKVYWAGSVHLNDTKHDFILDGLLNSNGGKYLAVACFDLVHKLKTQMEDSR